MNPRLPVKLFIATLLLAIQAAPSTPAMAGGPDPKLADGTQCTPWTPSTCFPQPAASPKS